MKKAKPKHTIRTATPGYFFGSMKAQETISKNAGRTRKSAKLPTSVEELRKVTREKT